MANFTPDRSGQINAVGGLTPTNAEARALYLKLFSGEVISRLPQARDLEGMVRTKTLRGGKEYQFPMTGGLTASYHTAGEQLTGQVSNAAERTIGLDQLMTVDRFTPKIDKWLSHYDDRQAYSFQMGETLGIHQDIHAFHEAIIGARQSTPLVVGNTKQVGLTIANDKLKLDTGDAAAAQNSSELATAFRAAMRAAAENYKTKDVPASSQKICYINWNLYYTILDAVDETGFSLFNKDYASGSLESGMLPPIYGIHVKGTNHLPTTNETDTNGINKYHLGDFSKTIGVIMCAGAVARVEASAVTVEVAGYDVSRKGQLVTADYMNGTGWLRPEMLIELKLDTLAN